MELYNRCDWLKAPDSITEPKPKYQQSWAPFRGTRQWACPCLFWILVLICRYGGVLIPPVSTSGFKCVSSSIRSPSASHWQGNVTAYLVPILIIPNNIPASISLIVTFKGKYWLDTLGLHYVIPNSKLFLLLRRCWFSIFLPLFSQDIYLFSNNK